MQRITVLVYTELRRRVAQNASHGTDHGTGGLACLFGGVLTVAGAHDCLVLEPGPRFRLDFSACGFQDVPRGRCSEWFQGLALPRSRNSPGQPRGSVVYGPLHCRYVAARRAELYRPDERSRRPVAPFNLAGTLIVQFHDRGPAAGAFPERRDVG